MKTNIFFIRAVSFFGILSLGLTFSCKEEESPFANEAAYAAEETIMDTYYEDADDMAGVAVGSNDQTGGNEKSSSSSGILDVEDDRFCASLTLELDIASTLSHPIGDINIDFGNGCEDPNGNVRKGKISVHFDGPRFEPGSSLVITFNNYFINGLKLNGVRTLTNITGSTETSPKFQIELVNGSVEWPDGTTATREHCFERTWDRGVILAPADDELVVTNCTESDFAATGMNRKGIDYTMTIEEELVYKRGCPLAISGVKKFVQTSSGKEIVIDYGAGDCDAQFTIMVDGNIHTVTGRRR